MTLFSLASRDPGYTSDFNFERLNVLPYVLPNNTKNKKRCVFPLISTIGIVIRACFHLPPKGEGKQADISATMAGMETIFGTNTTRVISHTMSL